jgi:protein TonB
MSRIFKLASIGLHSFVIAIVFVSEILNVGPLPVPHAALAFSDRFVTLADIHLPAPAPARSNRGPAPSLRTIPIDAPTGVAPEIPHAVAADAPLDRDGLGDVEQAGGGLNALSGMQGDSLPPVPPSVRPPSKPIPLHQGIVPPRKIVDVKPLYPSLAQVARQEGVVILETIIDTRGNVETVRVLRGYPLLDQPAVDAVRQWRFTPALLNGQPIPVVMTVTVNFTLK